MGTATASGGGMGGGRLLDGQDVKVKNSKKLISLNARTHLSTQKNIKHISIVLVIC